MSRVAPWLALIVAAAVAVVSVVELDRRADDESLAVEPTLVPSPLVSPPPPLTPEVTVAPEATPPRTQPAPEPTLEIDDTDVTPVPTPQPPRTPTPAPEVTPGPIDDARGPTPHTGGSSIPAGLLLAGIAGSLRVLLLRGRWSYWDARRKGVPPGGS